MRTALERGAPRKFRASGLVGWWRADMGITLNSGNVSTWADQSGSGNNLTQGTAANQPAYVASGQYNRPCVRPDGVNDDMSSPAFTTGVFTVFCAYKMISTGGYVWSQFEAGLANFQYLYRPAAGTMDLEAKRAGTVAQYTGAHTWNSGVSVGTVRFDGTSAGLVYAENSVDQHTGTGSNPGTGTHSNGFFIGRDFGGSGPANVDLYEIAFLGASLPASARWRIEAYMRGRYAL